MQLLWMWSRSEVPVLGEWTIISTAASHGYEVQFRKHPRQHTSNMSQLGMAIDALQVSHPHDDILVVALAMHGPGALTV